MIAQIVGGCCTFWYTGVSLICILGHSQIYRHYRTKRARGVSETLPIDHVPHVTIIRPIKGLEPDLRQCLAATFKQTYPQEKLTIYFCLPTRHDPANAVVEELLRDHPTFDANVFYEDEDSASRSSSAALGPNPKIGNMSRAYREGKGDLVWIIDCNVWVAKGAAGRLVDLLCGYSHSGSTRPYKFVHQLPLVVDITDEQGGLINSQANEHARPLSTDTSSSQTIPSKRFNKITTFQRIWQRGGGRLEELFLASAHGKWYTAINTLLIAPCIVGKSNMFRRSQLGELTSPSSPSDRPSGIDYFSHNICEDHLIGDLLWKNSVASESKQAFGKHAMLFGDLAIQPMAGMNVSEYIARRVRWLRVRKFTVTLATLVEPGTESGFCSLVGATAITTLPWFEQRLGVPPTWLVFVAFWLTSVVIWAAMDCALYGILHSMASVAMDADTPSLVRRRNLKRPFREWLFAWLGREMLTLPIWLWAVWGGTTVVWRGRKFKVGMDMRVRALDDDGGAEAVKDR